MSEFLPAEVREAMAAAQNASRKRRSRRTVRVGNQKFVVLRHWDQGFALDPQEDPPKRGVVDLYEDERHLCQALVIQSRDEAGERVFEVKYATPVTAQAPIVDFVRDEFAPVALLSKS